MHCSFASEILIFAGSILYHFSLGQEMKLNWYKIKCSLRLRKWEKGELL